MGTIAEDVTAYEADMDAHLARLNADPRWGGDALTLDQVDVSRSGEASITAISNLVAKLHSAADVEGVFPIDGAGLYLVLVYHPSSGDHKEYYGTTSGRTLVRALLDVWRMVDEETIKLERVRKQRRAEFAALQVLARERGITVDAMIDQLTKGER